MTRRLFLLIVAIVIIAATAVIILLPSDKSQSTAIDLSACKTTAMKDLIDCISEATSDKLAEPGSNPATLLPAIDRQVEGSNQQIIQFCHAAMHAAGRRFAEEKNVALAQLQDYLPRTDSFNCAAGFAHGMVSVIGVNPTNASQLIEVCARESTRVRQVACTHGIGHAFRRSFISDDKMKQTIAACKRLGPLVASDCAQGAYHDYIFAFEGIDDTRKLSDINQAAEICRGKPSDYISSCWYRLFIYYPEQFRFNGPKPLREFCRRQDRQRDCFAAGIAAFTIPPTMVEACRQFKGVEAVNCFSAVDLKGPGLKAIQLNDPAAQRRTIKRRQADLAFLMKRCLLMPDKRGERACVSALAYYSVAEQSALLSAEQSQTICRLANREFNNDCLRAVKQARDYYLRQT